LSRIGKLPLAVPDQVKVTVGAGRVKVEGPKGQLERTLPAEISVKQADGQLVFERPSDDYITARCTASCAAWSPTW